MGELAGIAADAQNAGGSKPTDESCKVGIRPRKEIRIAQLRGFITQAGKVVADFVAEPVRANGQANRRTRVVLGDAEGKMKECGRSCGSEANKISTIHRNEIAPQVAAGDNENEAQSRREV